ncbi:MAG: rhodanese-like domain-containing protein [Gammaproteobacteria bacterium]
MDRFIEFVLNHYLLALALVVVTFLLIQDLVESSFKKFKSLSPLLAVAKMNSADVAILDVREPNEFTKGFIEGAVNAPLGKLDSQLAQFDQYKNTPLIVVCQTGTRSVPACKTLTKAGFTDVYNVVGGMQAWEDARLPIKVSGKHNG